MDEIDPKQPSGDARVPSDALVKRLFFEACERPEEAREAFLIEAGGEDPILIARVRALLAADRAAGDAFFGAPTGGGIVGSSTVESEPAALRAPQGGIFAASAASEIAEAPGMRLGPYRLLQKVGEGGFGVVFMAEQEAPVRRKVAIKIIKLGMDTRQVVARFEQERQALALMDHPHIAKVLDAGATAGGRPYFVMELCTGDPITRYCDANSLSIAERLELVVQVCRAVHHAHQKGVIHRDLKPSNVLVSTQDGRPFARIIDFGIAKATSARIVERTLFTEHRQLIGTPEYMSPEQAEGSLDIDTRTDVYSIGVLVYELLAGSTPFDGERLRSAAFGELQRIIREVEPPAPSTRLSESRERLAGLASRRRSEPRKLGAIVRGELDWIVMKSLDKDRRRRYESASELGDDVVRFLEGRPVRAAPPSRAYAARKFMRRHRGPVLAAALLLGAILAGLVGTAIGFVRAERERAVAETARREGEIITAFLSEMLASPAPDARGREVRMREVLDTASATIDDRLDGFPRAETDLRRTIGNAYRALGEFDRAADHLAAALAIRVETLGPSDPDSVRARGDLAGIRQQQGRYDEAERLANEAISLHRGDPGDRMIVGIRNNLAQTLSRQGRDREAIAMQRDVVEGMRRAAGPTALDTIGVSVNLASMLERAGEPEEAERLLVALADDVVRAHGAEHPTALFTRSELGNFYRSTGRLDRAEPILRETLAERTRVLGDRHPDVGRSMANLGWVLAQRGDVANGRRLLVEAWELLDAALGADHPDTLHVAVDALEQFEADGWPEDAEVRVSKVLASVRRVAAAELVADETLNTCAWYLLTIEPASLRDPHLAVEAARRACANARLQRNPLLWTYLDTYALALARTGSPREAVDAQREAIERLPREDEGYRAEMEGRLREYEALVNDPATKASTPRTP
jgi:eukaryotic-like serine/threonine-protein kinase